MSHTSDRRRPHTATTYTLLDEMTASPVQPLSADKQAYQIGMMREGLRALQHDAEPVQGAWMVCADAVNFFETLVLQGVAQDPQGLLDDAVAALARAGERFKTHGPTALRLDGPGLHAVTAVLDDWADVISQLPARTVVRCLRVTEQRMRALRNGHRTARDVRVMDITT